MGDNYKVSQDYEIISPQKQQSYPITTREWTLLKDWIKKIRNDFNFWHTAGSILLGTAIPTVITAMIGDFKSEKSSWICWTAFFVTFPLGVLTFIFAWRQKISMSNNKDAVIEYMKTIENRFAQTPSQLLTIHSAKYGAKDNFFDVTEVLASKIMNNTLEVVADNGLAGDPCPGSGKKLIVDYSLRGVRRTSITTEGKALKMN